MSASSALAETFLCLGGGVFGGRGCGRVWQVVGVFVLRHALLCVRLVLCRSSIPVQQQSSTFQQSSPAVRTRTMMIGSALLGYIARIARAAS